jgi:hypothetical protein
MGLKMSISQIGKSASFESINSLLQNNYQKPANINSANADTIVKKDTLNLSEKAKDLLAKQSGTEFQEEQNESQTARMKETE